MFISTQASALHVSDRNGPSVVPAGRISTYHSLHIQYLQRSSWGWTVTVRNMYSWHLSTNKHLISATTLCISLECIYIANFHFYSRRPVLGLIQPPVQRAPRLFPRVKAKGRCVDHSPHLAPRLRIFWFIPVPSSVTPRQLTERPLSLLKERKGKERNGKERITMSSLTGSRSPRRGIQSALLDHLTWYWGQYYPSTHRSSRQRDAQEHLNLQHFRCDNLKSCITASCYMLIDWQTEDVNSAGKWTRLKSSFKLPCYLFMCPQFSTFETIDWFSRNTV